MITGTLFHTLAFPWLFINPNGGIVERGSGTLFPFPPGANEQATIAFCQRAAGEFLVAPDGYAVYMRELPFLRDYRLVLYGLKIKGVSTVHGKVEALSIKLSREDIQTYVEHFLAAAERTTTVVGDLINSSVHEIRGINTDIKHASQEITSQEFEKTINWTEIWRRAKNINALSEILSRRTDFLEFVANPQVTRIHRRRIRAYQKFDKVKRSLESRANQRNISIRIDGRSLGMIDGLVVFDVVPYLMVRALLDGSKRSQVLAGGR